MYQTGAVPDCHDSVGTLLEHLFTIVALVAVIGIMIHHNLVRMMTARDYILLLLRVQIELLSRSVDIGGALVYLTLVLFMYNSWRVIFNETDLVPITDFLSCHVVN